MIYSHPDKLLREHLENVQEIGLSVFDNKDCLFPTYELEYIKKTIELTLYYHDFGKATLFFQDYLEAQINQTDYHHNERLTYHALLSACIAAYKVNNVIDKLEIKELFSVFAFLAIRKHHGNFINLDEMLITSRKDWKILEEQWNAIQGDFKNDIDEICFYDLKEYIDELLCVSLTDTINHYILLNFIFSILVYADKTDVIIGKVNEKNNLKNNFNIITIYKNKKFKSLKKTKLNLFREKIYLESLNNIKSMHNDKILSLNLTTGAGKTLTVLNVALYLMNTGSNLNRIIYALPFTSIIDQLDLILKDIFNTNEMNHNDYLLIHHHLADINIKLGENYFDGDKAKFLIENWDKPLILTTFWQLFYTLISNKNIQIRKFHNIANSIIILDEIQTLPYKYWRLVHDLLLAIVENFNCKIIFLTATMPIIFQAEKNEINAITSDFDRKRYYAEFSRYKIKTINSLNDILLDELCKIAQKHIEKENTKSFLFVFNTKNSSMSFFKRIKDSFPDKNIFYLSTNILPVDRKKRIEMIKEDSKNKIIVSTQLIEAGVDIDLDIVYRDFAPLDSIVQTAGRCNRNNNTDKGEVFLFKLKNEKGMKDCNYIYQGISLNITNELFNNISEMNENELLALIDRYYKGIKDRLSTDESNNLLKCMRELNYEKLADEFNLISNGPEFSVFIEIDDKATELLNKFRVIMLIEYSFKRKEAFLKIRADFYQYVLSLRLNRNTISTYTSFDEIGNFKIISKAFAKSLYKDDIGFSERLCDDENSAFSFQCI